MQSPPPISVSPRCEIKQTRDHLLVQRAFDAMGPEDRAFLWENLKMEQRYERGEMPERDTPTGENFLWHELIAASRPADGMFFVVSDGSSADPLFVAPDPAIAQAFARRQDAQAREIVSPLATLRAVPYRSEPDRPEPDIKKPPATASPSLA